MAPSDRSSLFSFVTVAAAEDLLLFVMAYDRYVDIFNPLHYHRIMSQTNCTLITIGIWAAALLNSLMFLLSALYMSSCNSNLIHQFYCDVKSLTKTICIGRDILVLLMNFMEVFFFACVPLMCTFISYFKIFSIILKMKSRESRSKAFSTCSSHLAVISLYYVTCLAEYLIPSFSDVVDLVFSIIYVIVTPMINPIIYSLQNSNVKAGLLGFIKEIRNFKCDF
ncbi:hypothetical protein GDO81_029886 [Engystomops pustulosus]|uniref:G-protein coupled receptors family 1 profile domain-containing protein n=1 Tax=Engystomops pustulosus TaxID=76066 RepID=A0AAV6ZC36_ENGPU|nr:hypothetical protein GDO81_029886 [Engystomops pustulosus]